MEDFTPFARDLSLESICKMVHARRKWWAARKLSGAAVKLNAVRGSCIGVLPRPSLFPASACASVAARSHSNATRGGETLSARDEQARKTTHRSTGSALRMIENGANGQAVALAVQR
jgi:hypothetical protein